MNKLKYLRKLNKLRQEDVAKELRVSQPNYQLFESGKRQLNREYLEILARFYKVTPGFILDQTEEFLIRSDELAKLDKAKSQIEKIQSKSKRQD
jgi:transcriptional regulator with XRE-family HTH domain